MLNMQKLMVALCFALCFLCSCEDKDDETCMTCDAIITTEENGQQQSQAFLTMLKICDNQLERVLSNPTQIDSLQLNPFSPTYTITTTVYTCD
tara:strand:+ start:554 stop:832 length:279 start_codon:yes stop_codon:yes gene_type:complete